jgi:pimeloyl-ACP methyl ester carboxylesterase
MPVIDAHGIRGNVVFGRGERVPGRLDVVFVHGAGGDWSYWHQQRSYFSSDYNLFFMELPGHGGARGETTQDIQGCARWIKAALQELKVLNPIVIGHSMGGAITMELALRNPDLPRALVLVSTGARLKVLPAILDALTKDFPQAVALICKLSFAPDVRPEILKTAVQEMQKNTADILISDFTACGRFDFMEEVQAITVPTLVICGDQDSLTPIKYSQYLADKIAGASLAIIEGAGHLPMMERPQEFNKAVETFLNRVSNKDA